MHLHILLLLGGLGPTEIVLIIVGILVLFGGRKIPELMRGIGQGIKEFNNAKNTVKKEIEDGMKEDSSKDEKKSESNS
jgi:sec-independent protein translocase protein TatA